jgi:hypothetical protein
MHRQGEKVDVEGAIQSGGRDRTSVVHTAIGAGPERCLVAFLEAAKGPASAPWSVALMGSEPQRSADAKGSR